MERRYKYLGVIISDTYLVTSHGSYLCLGIKQKLGFIRRKLKNALTTVKWNAYNSLVRPESEYASVVEDRCTQKDKWKLKMVQRRAIRFVHGKHRRLDSPSQLMQADGIQALQLRRKINRMKFLFSLQQGQLRLGPLHYLTPLTSRTTRHIHQFSLTTIFARTNTLKYSIFPRAINDCNSSPLQLFNDTNLAQGLERLAH